MSQNLKVGTRVKLATFLNESEPPVDCDPFENYWKLIGQTGQVVEVFTESDRVLVAFDISVSSLGLHCHNPIPNSLRIQTRDLVVA